MIQSFSTHQSTETFPLSVLGPLMPVVDEIHAESRARHSSIVSALLCVMSLVTQGRIRVKKRRGLSSPVSLWFIVVQGSGERKTTVVRRLFQPVDAFVAEQNAAFAERLAQYSATLSAWHATEKGLRDAIRKKTERGQPTEYERQRLIDLAKEKPRRPKSFKLRHEKATAQALLMNLTESLPTTALISDEAGCVINSRALSDLGVLTKAWDGSSIASDLVSHGSVMIEDPSLTLGLFVQKEVLDKFLSGKGELARASGFLARCYVLSPLETAGTRFLAYAPDPGHEAQDRFAERCLSLLGEQVGDDEQFLPDKITMEFSPEAQVRWEQEHDLIEGHMAPGGFFYNQKDFASKHADKIARLAAILQYFEDGSAVISKDTLERSIAISGWFATQFVAYFAPKQPPPKVPQEMEDAQTLSIWLANFIRVNGMYSIKKNDVRSSGPNSTRNKLRLDAAIRVLHAQQIAGEGRIEGNRTVYIAMNPAYFTPFRVAQLCGVSTVNATGI